MTDPASDTTIERRDHPLLLSTGIRQIEGRSLSALPEGTLMARAAAALADVCARQLRRLPAVTGMQTRLVGDHGHRDIGPDRK